MLQQHSVSLGLILITTSLFISACTDKPNDPVIVVTTPCTADAQVKCLANENFPALDKAALTAKAASLKSGVTVTGVAGSLANCSADNQSSCLATAEFPSIVKSTFTQDAIASGQTLGGVAGAFAPSCTADASTACLATADFKAVNVAGLGSWDLRAGKTFAGVSGSLTFYTNGATFATFNRTAGTGASSSTTEADAYDTINDIEPIPVLMPPSGAPVVSNWIREATSDTDSDETCSAMESCIYTDLLTGLSWHEDNGNLYLWEDAIDLCENLVVGAHSDWRLPTQKELLGAYINRIYSLRAPLNLLTNDTMARGYISATTVSLVTTAAWNVKVGQGLSAARAKASDTDRVLCVRQT